MDVRRLPSIWSSLTPKVAEAIAHRLAGGPGGDEQPLLDVSLDEYEGRPKSGEPL